MKITSSFWAPRIHDINTQGLFHQWDQLERSGCIDNFRIVARMKDGPHMGWFFADSDAFKWLDAASRIYANKPNPPLDTKLDEFIAILRNAQEEDGYLYTYNQINFPRSRWENLLIEHELYCLGHLIEAGVSHFQATRKTSALAIARKAADLLVNEFLPSESYLPDGHEEVEIALLRLYGITSHQPYIDLASSLLARRGHMNRLAFMHELLSQNYRVRARKRMAIENRQRWFESHQALNRWTPLGNKAKTPRDSQIRWLASALSGQYFQMHAPLERQCVPVGHSVRFGYLMTAAAMLTRLGRSTKFLPTMETAWEHMVTRRMYVTGGLGALPALEGFGCDYELDPEIAYAETCAALACLLWNWELVCLTEKTKYSDLFEWQLYNAAAVGMGINGNTYLYNNPLACHGGLTRQPWYAVPCCPSNLSRIWASIGSYVCSTDLNDIWIHQYIGGEYTLANGSTILKMESGFPWNGNVRIKVGLVTPTQFTLHLRRPSWAGDISLKINKHQVQTGNLTSRPACAAGYDPRLAGEIAIRRTWETGDVIDLEMVMPIVVRQASPRVRGHRNKVSLSRGPIVYCLESLDNPGLNLFRARLDTQSISSSHSPAFLEGATLIYARTNNDQPLTFIPYFLWANRGASKMTVWVNGPTV